MTFNRDNNVSRYFIIATVIMTDWRPVSIGLQNLRHELIADGLDLNDYFHATNDAQDVRDRVFSELQNHPFSVQATICEKSKAEPQVTVSKARFYKTPWFFHCKYGLAPNLRRSDGVHITAASIGTRRERLTFTNALNDIKDQNFNEVPSTVDFRPCSSDPCLQVADYCAWAIQRKWERNDDRSYRLISERITREYDLWKRGNTHHY